MKCARLTGQVSKARIEKPGHLANWVREIMQPVCRMLLKTPIEPLMFGYRP